MFHSTKISGNPHPKSWQKMCPNGSGTRLVWPSGKCRFIQQAKISVIQAEIFG